MKKLIGQTETIWDNSDPQFIASFEVKYFFEESQTFIAEAYDTDDVDNQRDLTKQEIIGRAEFSLHQVVSSKDQKFKTPLTTL